MKLGQISLAGAALAFLALGSPACAAGSAVPGRSVGHVFLGMDRADVWKILGKPGLSQTVPHGMSLYGEDEWEKGDRRLTVVSERDKVIQVEFNSPHITTTDGLSTAIPLSQVRRHHPKMTVLLYGLEDGPDNGSEGFYREGGHRVYHQHAGGGGAVIPALSADDTHCASSGIPGRPDL